MNKICLRAMLLLMCITVLFAQKVLIVVNEDYYNYDTHPVSGKNLITAYESKVQEKDLKSTEVIPFPPGMGTDYPLQCLNLWDRLADEYQEDNSLEGAVLIGELPIPITYNDHSGRKGNYRNIYTNTHTIAERSAQYVYIYGGPCTITSLSIYYDGGGSGKMILGLYNNNDNGTPDQLDDFPDQREGITLETDIQGNRGWQKVDLITPVKIKQLRDTLWIAWCFESNPGIFRQSTTSYSDARSSTVSWVSGGDNMPAAFGTIGSDLNHRYNVYFSYIDAPGTAGLFCPIDYPLMDVCDATGNEYLIPFYQENDWDDGIWPTIEIDAITYFEWSDEKSYNGDGEADIWISRIYGPKLNTLRGEDQPWGIFLEEYAIYDQYLERVIERMTTRATVPPRKFALGSAHQTDPDDNLRSLQAKYKVPGIDDTRFIVYPGNTPSNLQAQLQAGPYGGSTWGASGGVNFFDVSGDDCRIDNMYLEYYDPVEPDTRGYEWACLYIHSGPGGHAFHSIHPMLHGGEFGIFCSVLGSKPWDQFTSGGWPNPSGRSDYFVTYESDYIDPSILDESDGAALNSPSRYLFQYRDAGQYQAHCYIPSVFSQADLNEIYINLDIFDPATGDRVERYDHGIDVLQVAPDGWAKIWPRSDPWQNLNPSGLPNFDIVISINCLEINDDGSDKVVVADAVRLTKNGGGEWIEDNLPDMHEMVDQFPNTQRAFTSMPDDGGRSKSHFFIYNCCSINNFLKNDNLGNMYGLAHNGLISLGRPTTCYPTHYKDDFLPAMNQGASFGEATLDFVNEDFPHLGSYTFALLGAGTLKSLAYIPYLDLTNDNETYSINVNSKKELWAKQNVTMENMHVFGSSPYTDEPELKLTAGREIRIVPEFRAEYGCSMHLKIDGTLQ